jgi:hypothetical protein
MLGYDTYWENENSLFSCFNVLKCAHGSRFHALKC